MSNPRHLSESVEWYSPELVVEPARALLGGIELDPASCAVANRTVRAERFFTREQDGLSQPWKARTVFLNAPGSKVGNKSQQNLFWQKLARAWMSGDVSAAIFVCFSVELLQVSQGYGEGMPIPLDFPMCFPSSRVPYVKASEDVVTPQASLFGEAREARIEESEAPPHASVIVYLPSRIGDGPSISTRATGQFLESFSPIGRCIWTREGW